MGEGLPSLKDIDSMESSVQMEALLNRDDIGELSPEAWFVAVSRCASGMLLAEHGIPEGELWARLLLRAIDEANARSVLSKREIISRRMRACAAAVFYFGVRAGDPLCDPKLAFLWLVSELGSRKDLLLKFTELASVKFDSVSIVEFSQLSGWQTGVISALQSLCEIEKHVDDPDLRAEMHAWCKLCEELPRMSVK